MAAKTAQIQAEPGYTLALVLILIGCFTKSAQFPFHFWLPQAMAAPTPVSAYLHSATMVKAGLFLLMRLYPVLGGHTSFEWLVAGTGLFTMVFGAWRALFQHDLKGLLAYSTISHLGLVTFLIGLDSPLSAVAAVFHVLNHATFKAALFMTAGIIDHETGSRDMRRINGLFKAMPWTASLAMVAAAAMAGVPLMNGFLSKEMLFDQALQTRLGGLGSGVIAVLVTAAAAIAVAYSLRFIHDVFFNGEPHDLPNPHPHEPPLFMKVPVAIFAAVCVAVGLFPALILGPLVDVAAAAVLGRATPGYELALWHGFNGPLLMSLLGIVVGVALYLFLARDRRLHRHTAGAFRAERVFAAGVAGLVHLARRVIDRLDRGSLQSQLATMLGLALVLAAWPFVGGPVPGTGGRHLLPATALAGLLWLVVLATCAALVRGHHQRFQAVVWVGIVGLVTALTFLAFSAPDLALTQLAVELVSTVMLLMGLALLPKKSPRESSGQRRLRDAALALAGGAGVAWLAWWVMTRDHSSMAGYFLENAATLGGGQNVVNVILVDFRGFDTLGEITVLCIAALGVMAVMEDFQIRQPAEVAQGPSRLEPRASLLMRQAAQVLLPLALVVAVYLFWRGHNLPGGGFLAGLIISVALVLQVQALGPTRVDELLRAGANRRSVRCMAWGLAIALCTGLGSWIFDQPFLTSAFGHPVLPLLGELPLASAALFDLGVFLTVVGAAWLPLSILASADLQGGAATGAGALPAAAATASPGAP